MVSLLGFVFGKKFNTNFITLLRKSSLMLNRNIVNTKLLEADLPVVELKEVKRFVTECMESINIPNRYAVALAEILADADYRGHYSQGLNSLEEHLNSVESTLCKTEWNPKILSESPATAWVDGCFNLGVVVGLFCMNIAIQKAKKVGIGWVTCKGSNNNSISSFYVLKAVKEDLIGFTCCNTLPAVVPTRGRKVALGTNPLCLAAPCKCENGFILDMTTAATSVEKIEKYKRKNQPLPNGWAVDVKGEETTDPSHAASLLPLGGCEHSSGYKGYGLAFMIDILCGVLSGGTYGPNIVGNVKEHSNLSQTYVAIDPNRFAPDFQSRMQNMIQTIKRIQPVNSSYPVWIPGDPERFHMKAVDEAGGVKYTRKQMDDWEEIALKYGVAPLKTKGKKCV